MRVLVLGGYGLIGAAVVARLVEEGHAVVALGRSVEAARARRPDVEWVARDIARLTESAAWAPLLDGVDAVVNCTGALQDGARDDVAAVQRDAMLALYRACAAAGVSRFVQVSATGVALDAPTPFMRTKAEADAALMASALEWTVLRPGLVIAPAAYGATALLRGLASFPGLVPLARGEARVQTVAVEEVAEAVAAALAGRVPARRVYDLVEDEARTLAEVVALIRQWLGRPPVPVLPVPGALGAMMFRVGDFLGLLGWRPPLRTTALRQIEAGVAGDPAAWAAATGRRLAPLAETLRRMPSTVQERWFGRLFLMKPVAIGTLSLFWLASGAIGLIRLDAAAAVLSGRGVAPALAGAAAAGGAVLDLALGLAVLVRPSFKPAAAGMIVVTLAYLTGGTLVAPDLWLDPLGPYVKAVPAAVLALVALAVAEER
ncbi:MAG TPA: SDR family oxidoreductase [Beijerinckiaceae bacterium]|jgi:uncharacterized protein YbjT (DUF2867 family)